jgi:putative oxidoreductase
MFHSKLLHRPNIGILILRIVVGAVFIYAGVEKLSNMQQTIQFFGMIGFGAFWAWLVSLVEVIGGVLLVVGYATQIAGILLFITMAVAVEKIFGQAGFMGSLGAIMLGVSALVIAISGCGKYSICGMAHGKNCTTCKADGMCGCQHPAGK